MLAKTVLKGVANRIILRSIVQVRFQQTDATDPALVQLDRRPLYLDAQATTVIDPRVLDAMLPYMTNMYGNPHSRTHAFGWESEDAVEHARKVFKKISYLH